MPRSWSSPRRPSTRAATPTSTRSATPTACSSPLLGLGIASTLFAIALLASGLNSTVTATLAGQIVMEGFLRLRLPSWARRLLTRGIAIVPVVVVTALYGESGTAKLLVLSQVILSMQLPFAVIPLVRFVTDRRKMGAFVVPRAGGRARLDRRRDHRDAQRQAALRLRHRLSRRQRRILRSRPSSPRYRARNPRPPPARGGAGLATVRTRAAARSAAGAGARSS